MSDGQQPDKPLDFSTEILVGTVTLLAMGVVYAWVYYGRFGINVIDYFDASDFIVLSLLNKVAAIYSVFAVGISHYLFAKFPRLSSIIVAAVFGCGVLVSGVLSCQAAKAILESASSIELERANPSGDTQVAIGRQVCVIELEGEDDAISGVVLVGKAGDFVVYFDGTSTFLRNSASIKSVGCPIKTNG